MANPTLNRFYSFHFLLPFVIAVLVLLHLIFLHDTGSSNPLGLTFSADKVPFSPYFSVKDLLGVVVYLVGFFILRFFMS